MPDEKNRSAEAKPDWDGPAQNPAFGGATPRDLAQALLRKVGERQPAAPKERKAS